jgi:hypothetical protein
MLSENIRRPGLDEITIPGLSSKVQVRKLHGGLHVLSHSHSVLFTEEMLEEVQAYITLNMHQVECMPDGQELCSQYRDVRHTPEWIHVNQLKVRTTRLL